MNLYDDALCRTDRSVDWFLQHANTGRGTDPVYDANLAAARALCARCPVRDECLRMALDHPFTGGVWAGTTEYERTRLPKRGKRRAVCGTDSGYYHHLRWAKDEPCADCKAAHSAANSKRASA